MIADLESLVKLQEIDRRIHELMHAKESFPEAISSLENSINAALHEIEGLNKKSGAALEEKKTIEEQIADAKKQLDKSQERLGAIKTNREYDAVHTQIENFNNVVSTGNARLKALELEMEEIRKSVESSNAELERIKSQNDPQIAELKGKIDTIGASIAQATGERNSVMASIPKALLRTYEYILKRRKNGQVLSYVNERNRTCSVCFKILEPQLINEIRKASKYLICQNCGSIFMWQNQAETGE